jgi:hypothetical protein
MPNPKFVPHRHQSAHTPDYQLAALLPMWPHELSDTSRAGCEKRLSLLRRALRAERRRGIAGHWTYDLGRHAALLRFYQRERALLTNRAGNALCSTKYK